MHPKRSLKKDQRIAALRLLKHDSQKIVSSSRAGLHLCQPKPSIALRAPKLVE